ncbi:hypothetical protein BMR85_019180 [Achromobacter sp. KAs 3-5]|nr:hypothetical protein BMR85_019180 [Achromobacter sp. KAs 3-5]
MSLKSGYVTLRRAALAVAMASALGAATAHAQEAAKSGRVARAAQPEAASTAPAAVTVLAAHPVVFALTDSLAKDSSIRVNVRARQPAGHAADVLLQRPRRRGAAKSRRLRRRGRGPAFHLAR